VKLRYSFAFVLAEDLNLFISYFNIDEFLYTFSMRFRSRLIQKCVFAVS